MAYPQFARSASVSTTLPVVTTGGSSDGPGPISVRGRRGRFPPTSHLSAEEYARLLACIEDAGGVTTLDVISRALPRVPRPVSAVFDLCDVGVLNVDWESAFDGDMHVWYVGR